MRPSRPNVAVPTSLPAPVGGWNARDSLGAMPPTDAVQLTNFVPMPTSCVLRNGYSNFATGMTGQVNTVMGLNGMSTNKLLAAVGTNIYDITAGGAVGAAVQTGLGSDKWQHVTFSNSAGTFLYMVNGIDAPRYWDGTTWTIAAITGIADLTKLVNINSNHNRLWFCESGTLTAWYLAVNAIAGPATAFFLTGVARKGGYLMSIATWTIDAGYGMNDMVAFITSNGEIILYQGTDPAAAATWSLLGVFEVGTPIGRRCFMKFKGDLLLITRDGVTTMSQGLQSSRLDPRVNITDKIQSATATAINTYGTSFGWQLVQLPKANLILLNVPVASASGGQQQYVMNTITGSWCNFTGWNANCWELFQDDIYYGGNGIVAKAWDTNSDNTSQINGEGIQAFNYFGSSGILKRFTMMRPVMRTNGAPSALCGVNVDFDTSTTSLPLVAVVVASGIWDTGLWDSALWGGGLNVAQQWQGVNAVGYCGAAHFITASKTLQIEWVSTDLVMERGAVL